MFVRKKEGQVMLAMSPDGIMYSTWKDDEGNEVRKISLVEYKCPVPSPIAYDRGYSEAEDDVELEKTARLFNRLPDSFDYFKNGFTNSGAVGVNANNQGCTKQTCCPNA